MSAVEYYYHLEIDFAVFHSHETRTAEITLLLRPSTVRAVVNGFACADFVRLLSFSGRRVIIVRR